MRVVLFCLLSLLSFAMPWMQTRSKATPAAPVHVPTYTANGELMPQLDYREWVYLSSGLDMSYTAGAPAGGGHSVFDTVFANPEAYRSFQQTGTWPDKTVLVAEQRGAESKGSINRAGHFQGEELIGVEVHVKDAARGGWAFYAFRGPVPAAMVPKTADCYSCHRDHAAVDTTFVQFYPTLMPLARQKRTLSAAYQKDVKQATAAD